MQLSTHPSDPVTSEERLIPASDPDSGPVLVSPRRVGHEYSVDHQGDRFVIRTNDTHKNSRLATSPADDPTESSWMPLLEASDSHYIRAVDAFQDFIAVEERVGGLDHIRLIDRAGRSTFITFPESVYAARIDTNSEFETGTLRLEYTSMVTPITVFDYHVDADELEVRRIQQIPSGYDPTEYVTERVWVAARDGAQVPVSTVRRKRTHHWMALRLCICMDTARMAMLSRLHFPHESCRFWIAASYSPSHTFAEVTIWDTTGTRPANWTSAPTRSTTSWMSREA